MRLTRESFRAHSPRTPTPMHELSERRDHRRKRRERRRTLRRRAGVREAANVTVGQESSARSTRQRVENANEVPPPD
jgi:hypothetical protein